MQGLIISQMLRKSVETRDWVNTIEPRNVRAVMKRVVEDTTSIDVQVQFAFCSNHHLRLSPQCYSLYVITMCGERIFWMGCASLQVGLLYEEGVRKAHSSDSSKRTFSVYSSSRQQARYAASYTPRLGNSSKLSALFPVWDVTWHFFLVNLCSAPMDTNLLSNIHKLFSERIDIFSSVEFNKVRSCASRSLTVLKMCHSHPRRSLQVSVMTGIIKISLKTFLECVRLRTFGRYGLQQIQVDCHYLQMYLWRFVSDENLVHFLLDEIMGSSAHRCLDPVPMEQSVIEVICERGWD